MNIDAERLWEFQKIFEGYREHAYDDGVGNLTIGVGHANQDTEPFDADSVWDEDKIFAVWQEDIQRAIDLANGWLRREDIPQPYFDVLVDIIFNVGKKPTGLVRALNTHDLQQANMEILRWVWAGGKVLLGLVKRRFAALAMCYGDNWGEIADCPLSRNNLDEFNGLIRRYGYAVETHPQQGYEIVEV